MRMSELSRISGVSIPTIKFYLREGLLPAGTTTTAPNQAEYHDLHLHRLRLVRTLIEIGGLGVASVQAVLAAIDDPGLSLHDMLGVAHGALSSAGGQVEPAPGLAPDMAPDAAQAGRDVDRFLDQLGWRIGAATPARGELIDALVALRRLGRYVSAATFAPYAALADQMAAWEVASLPAEAPRAEAVEAVVVGTVVYGAALQALRKLAQAQHSARRFSPPPPPPPPRRRSRAAG